MNIQAFERYESEVRSYCRKFPAVFTWAKDSFLYDEQRRKYLDFFCGAGALNYGHNNDFIKQRLLKHLESDGVMHALDMYTAPKRDFLCFFQEQVLRPRGLDYVIQFPGPTGTNSVEAALKLARKVTGRKSIFAFMGAFHGMTLGSLALTTDRESRAGGGVTLSDVVHIPAPYMFPELDTILYMRRLLTDDHSGIDLPAAVIVETVQAEGGVYVFEDRWLQRLRALCDEFGILLIVDDIQVGCGRTGDFFSFQRAGIRPDIVCLSKSIGGYGMPFALTLFRPELDKWLPGEHNGTFRGYQLSMVAAKAGLELMLQENTEQRASALGAKAGEFLRAEMAAIDPRIQVRGLGLIWGVDFGALEGNVAGSVIAKCFEMGLICESAGRGNAVVKLMPSLLITEAQLQDGLTIFAAAVKATLC